MSASHAESQRLRLRESHLHDEQTRAHPPSSGGAPCVLAATINDGTYPTSPAVFYACTPLDLIGDETAGSAGTTSTAGATFYALNLGATIPPLGTKVLVTQLGRWVFRYD